MQIYKQGEVVRAKLDLPDGVGRAGERFVVEGSNALSVIDVLHVRRRGDSALIACHASNFELVPQVSIDADTARSLMDAADAAKLLMAALKPVADFGRVVKEIGLDFSPGVEITSDGGSHASINMAELDAVLDAEVAAINAGLRP